MAAESPQRLIDIWVYLSATPLLGLTLRFAPQKDINTARPKKWDHTTQTTADAGTAS